MRTLKYAKYEFAMSMGKLDYLLKYTSKPKKSKKTSIKTDDLPVAPQKPPIDSQNKGFKRIDSQEIKSNEPIQKPESQQTVYRDLSGKVIDISTAKATRKPTSQIVINEEKKSEETSKSFTISKHDSEYNEYLKGKSSHDDPFREKVTSSKMTYNKGVNLPNRFGIKAGVMWDGIDRSNGFEKLVMAKRNEKKAYAKREVDEYEMDFE